MKTTPALFLFPLLLLRTGQNTFITSPTEPVSDIVCWFLLLIIVGFIHRSQRDVWAENECPSYSSLLTWSIVVGLIVSTLCQSLVTNIWIWPTLSFIVHEFGFTRVSFKTIPHPSQPKTGSRWRTRFLKIAVAALSTVALTQGYDIRAICLNLVFLAAQVSLYVPLYMATGKVDDGKNRRILTSLAKSVTARVLPIMLSFTTFRLWKAGDPINKSFSFICLLDGAVKMIQWALICRISESPPWGVMATSATFAAFSTPLSVGPVNLTKAIIYFLGSWSALTHTVSFLPSYHRGLSWLYLLALVPLGFLVLNSQRMTPNSASPANWSPKTHPVKGLSDHYKSQFHQMTQRQSSTYDKAVREYKRRYKRPPPPRFDMWFSYAKKHNATIIDDYDTIEESLAPFKSFDSALLQTAPKNLLRSDDSLAECSTHDGFCDLDYADWFGSQITKMLQNRDPLPNLRLLMNTMDEPQVLIDPKSDGKVTWTDESGVSIWRHATKYCPSENNTKPKKNNLSHLKSLALPFVRDVRDSKDICRYPEYANVHGFFQSPLSTHFTAAPIPVLSSAKVSTFADILYPPPLYMNQYDRKKYVDADDRLWENKTNQLYWAGSTTGSWAHDDSWRNHHRQRFVDRVNQSNDSKISLLVQSGSGEWKPYQSANILPQLYNAKFTAIIQCDTQRCNDEKAHFKQGPRESMRAAFKHEFLFDLDGNSFSMRFYTLLESRSVVLKQTLFQEWHDDRLVPWVHYVPVSMDMGELPELMRYLALTDEGAKIARQIADAGREWVRKALRREDPRIYMYRLILELHRLFGGEANNSTEH